jgi:hypothetical protein
VRAHAIEQVAAAAAEPQVHAVSSLAPEVVVPVSAPGTRASSFPLPRMFKCLALPERLIPSVNPVGPSQDAGMPAHHRSRRVENLVNRCVNATRPTQFLVTNQTLTDAPQVRCRGGRVRFERPRGRHHRRESGGVHPGTPDPTHPNVPGAQTYFSELFGTRGRGYILDADFTRNNTQVKLMNGVPCEYFHKFSVCVHQRRGWL